MKHISEPDISNKHISAFVTAFPQKHFCCSNWCTLL